MSDGEARGVWTVARAMEKRAAFGRSRSTGRPAVVSDLGHHVAETTVPHGGNSLLVTREAALLGIVSLFFVCLFSSLLGIRAGGKH